MHPLPSFYFFLIFLKCYFRVDIFANSSHNVSNTGPSRPISCLYIFFHKSTSPKVSAWIVTDFEKSPAIWTFLRWTGAFVFHKHLVVLLKVHVVLLNHIAARSYRLCLCSYYYFKNRICSLPNESKQ